MPTRQTNPLLKATLLEVVDNQLRPNDPPETRSTLNRLIAEGYSEKQPKEFIACAVTAELFDIVKNNEESDIQRYVASLDKLPKLPWD